MQIAAVINALTKAGGQVDSQTHLRSAVMAELNCGEATARRAINQALEMRKIFVVLRGGTPPEHVYRLGDNPDPVKIDCKEVGITEFVFAKEEVTPTPQGILTYLLENIIKPQPRVIDSIGFCKEDRPSEDNISNKSR